MEITNIPFTHDALDLPYVCHEGELKTTLRDKETTFKGHIVADISPSFRVVVKCTGSWPLHPFIDRLDVEFAGFANTLKLLVIGSESLSDNGGPIRLTGLVNSPAEWGADQTIARIRFLLVNFQHRGGAAILTSEGNTGWAGRITANFGRWQLTLDALRDCSERFRGAVENRAFAVTHVGDLRLIDNKLFKSDKAKDVIEFVSRLMTFVSGSHCGPVLPFGYRGESAPIWKLLGNPVISPAKRTSSWFLAHEANHCMQVASGMFELWQDKEKRSWIELATGLYAECCRIHSNLDIALITAQMLLELLASVVLTEERARISDPGFSRMDASDRIRILLLWCGIETTIPSRFRHLRNAIKKTKVTDGPQAITDIRNCLIHPTRDNRTWIRGMEDMARFEAWQLSLWYIDLVLLKLFGYDGPYNNRLGRERENTAWDMLPWST